MTNHTIRDDDQAGRFVARDGDEEGGSLAYRRDHDTLTLIHTEVRPQLRGTGLARDLVHFAMREAAAASQLVVPRCGYVVAVLRRHPEYEAQVHPNWRERLYGGAHASDMESTTCEIRKAED